MIMGWRVTMDSSRSWSTCRVYVGIDATKALLAHRSTPCYIIGALCQASAPSHNQCSSSCRLCSMLFVIRVLLAQNVLQIRSSPHDRIPRLPFRRIAVWVSAITRARSQRVIRNVWQISTLYVSTFLELVFDRLGRRVRFLKGINILLSLVLLLSHGALDWSEQTLEAISA